MLLVDSHCHLNFPEFEGKLDDTIKRAEDNDVKIMQTICTRMSEFGAIQTIANDHANIYCSVGIHPHNVAETDLITKDELVEKTKGEKVIGIGETGLDYFYEHSPRDLQQTSFRTHIAACRDTRLPLIVHTRDADDDTINILQDEHGSGVFPGLIHCFSGTRILAEAAIDLGLYVSISGIITFKKAEDLRNVVKDLPLEKLLVETDAPYLAPVPHRGKPNEPAFTRHTAECLAELKGVSLDEVAKITTDNFFQLFTKARRNM